MASLLSDILKNVGKPGSAPWMPNDFGITEKFGFGKYSSNAGTGSVQGPSTQAPQASYSTQNATPAITYSTAPRGNRDVPSYSQSSGNTNTQTQDTSNDDLERQMQAQKEARNKVRNSIKDRTKGYMSYLDNLAGMLPGQEAEDTNFLNQNIDNATNLLGQAKDAGLAKLDVSRGQVESNAKKTITDLQENLRNQMSATNMQLGAMGAGNSSASEVMAPYAFSKLGTKGRVEVMGQKNDQLANINLKEQDVITTYDTEKSQIEREKIDALTQIKSFYRDKLMQVQEAKAMADDRGKQALENLEMGILNEVSQRLGQVQNFVMQRNAQLEDWTRSRMAQLNDIKIQMSNTANFNPQDILYSEIGGLQGMDQSAGDPLLNLGVKKKYTEDQGF